MLLTLVLLFTVLPMAEIALLVRLGDWIGWPQTLLIALGTGVLGASLARWQGVATLGRLQRQLRSGEPPGDTLLDGVLILLAGFVLITPGVITDVVGFALLAPPVRALARWWFKRSLGRGVRRQSADGRTVVWTYGETRIGGPGAAPGDVVDAEVIEVRTHQRDGEPD